MFQGWPLEEVSLFHRPRARSDMLSGYSYKSSQYGLTVDNIARFELVLPNGTITNVTSKDEDLWFGLRVSEETRCVLIWLRVYNYREDRIISYAINSMQGSIS